MHPTVRLALLLPAVLVASCSSGDDDGGEGGPEIGSTSSIAPPVTPELPAESPPGTGVVVIGGTTATFAVTACELEPGEAEGATAPLVLVTGQGTRGNGVAFTVEVARTSTEDETFSDLITYVDTARILQVQRSELAGEVSDLRDPAARSTLLRLRPGGLSATGIAGPPGTRAPQGPGLVGLSLDASC